MRTDTRGLPRLPESPPAARGGNGAAAELGTMPEWNARRSLPAPDAPEVARDLEKARPRPDASRRPISGKLAAPRRRRARAGRAIEAYESLDRASSASSAPMPACSMPPTQSDPDARQVLRRHPGEAHGHHHRPHLLRAGAQPDRGRGAGGARSRARARPLQAVDRRTAQGEALPARGDSWSGCSTRRAITSHCGLGPAVQRDDDGAALRRGGRAGAAAARADAQLAHPTRRRRSGRAAAEALAKVFKDNVRLFTLITNTLAKDKEISDRWRGFKDVADSRHLANRVEARGRRRAGEEPCATPTRACRIATTR